MVKKIRKKILPNYFECVRSGLKTFELRKDEDNIEVGDLLVLREWTGEKYTGREIYADVTYVLRDVPEYGLKEGYCIFGMRPLLPCPYISRNLCDEEEAMK